jgi:hypothetical protein
MLEANWEKSLYIHHVNIDFVPGRLVDDGGTIPGELRGGLALVYLKPEIRSCKLVINQTAKKMYEKILQNLA